MSPSVANISAKTDIPISREFDWQTATYADGHLYIVYIHTTAAGIEQYICSFAMADVVAIFEDLPVCGDHAQNVNDADIVAGRNGLQPDFQIPRNFTSCTSGRMLELEVSYCGSSNAILRRSLIAGIAIAYFE